MANHISAWKRIRQNSKRQERNTHYKTIVKHNIQIVRDAIKAQEPEKAQKALRETVSAISRVAAKGIVHKNTASRKIAKLSKAVHNLTHGTATE